MTKEEYKECFDGKNILITGGLGFIGSNLACRLVDFGANVVLLDSLIPQYGGNLFNIDGIKEKVAVNIADVRDEFSMNYLVRGKDYLFNLAGTLSHIDSMLDPYADLDINCRSQLTILEACRKNNRGVKIVFAGTRGQYGRANYLPVDEKHPMCPVDVNGINNMAGEWYHILYNDTYGIKTMSLRLTNTYGPRHQMRHSKQGFLNWFIRLAMEGEQIQIYGDGKQLRDFNYVDDVVEAMLLAAASNNTNGEVFNLGSGKPISVLDVTKEILDTVKNGSYKLIEFPKDKKKIEVGDYSASFEKFSEVTGWQPKTSLKEGLVKTFEFYKTTKQHYW